MQTPSELSVREIHFSKGQFCCHRGGGANFQGARAGDIEHEVAEIEVRDDFISFFILHTLFLEPHI